MHKAHATRGNSAQGYLTAYLFPTVRLTILSFVKYNIRSHAKEPVNGNTILHLFYNHIAMSATQIEKLIVQNSKGLPAEILQEILDFIEFLKFKRVV